MDYSIRIGGQAGQGLQTIGAVLAKVFARKGFNVFTHQDYMSRIRGGHNFYQVRFSDRPVSSSRRHVDILIALDRNTAELHHGDLTPGGMVIYDADTIRQKYDEPEFFDIPFRKIAMDAAGVRLMENTVAVGAVMGMLKMDLAVLEKLLDETFSRKGKEVVEQNVAAARAGSAYAAKHCGKCQYEVPATGGNGGQMLIEGISSIGLGAILSGCRFYAAYPMTPSTGLLTFMAGQSKKYSIIAEQAEDEIAAINMALGASFAGVRAMTGSAGGGFALMVEGLSLAGMTETPIVIFEGQRPAPATGLPTRTEQGDLMYVLNAAHGEFPRVIMAPGNPEQSFYLTNKAFDLAEKYQIPAFIITDQYLVDAEWTTPRFDTSKLKYEDYRLRAEQLEGLEEYKRHAFTDTGVSPLAEPGTSPHLVVTDSDEHDEEGHIIEDAPTRVRMVEKRLLKKLPLIRAEMAPPLLYGSEEPETVLTGWGSTYGVLREVVDILQKDRSIAMLHFSEIWPFPSTDEFDFLKVLNDAGRAVCVENNATSQFARLVRMETGFDFPEKLNRFDGRPFLLDDLLEYLDA